MNFKSRNWSCVKDLQSVVSQSGQPEIKAFVEYTFAKLELEVTGTTVSHSPTTIVVLWRGNDRFIGIAQCGPRDKYSKELGREIAAGRAMSEMLAYIENDSEPYEVWECDGLSVNIFGYMPQDVNDNFDDRLVFP